MEEIPPPYRNGVLRKMTRSLTKLLVVVILLGYLLVWVMMPTDTYFLQWFPNVLSKTNSTFLEQQGGSILIYVFPVLFIATLGSLYIHFGKGEKRSGRWDSWKRPAIVRGPLGIVSWMELSFLTMFSALFVWSIYSYMHSMFRDAPKEARGNGISVWEAKLESSALLLGLVGKITLALLFFPVTRGSSVLRLFGLTSEASIKYHIWLGHTAIAFFTAHGLCYVIFWGQTHQILKMLKWDKVGVSNLAGEISLVAGLVMWATTYPRIRRKIFELFFYTHYLYIIFTVFFVLHIGFATASIMIPGFYLFLVDRYLRFLQSQQHVRLVSARLLPCRAVELNFSKNPGLRYSPTSTVFVNVPALSRLQWHPFTVTSSSSLEPDRLSVLIKSEGSWSKGLYQSLSSVERLQVSLEGPYGPPLTVFMRHDMLVMVSGGSGITPFISIARELLHLATTTSEKTIPRLLLICAFRTSDDLSMLDLLLPISGTNLDPSRLHIQIEAYVTRETTKPYITEQHSPTLRTMLFKPDPRDAPISAVLGPNSWLWLGLIISSSFVIFLILIGILTRCYIYHIEYRPSRAYSDSLRALSYMMFMCISIALTATGGFIWNKRWSGQEIGQVRNTETTLMSSPSQVVDDMGQELESLPRHTLRQATRVHQGKRPNLKKILLECEGSSIGVLVSGPKKMREEVAAICSDLSVCNLHFESISFSW